jgi:phosphoesterase RecJ-like protein
MAEQILTVIREYERFAITTHLGPEADAIGSQLALQHMLRALGKETWAVLRDPVPETLRFLPGSDSIHSTLPVSRSEIDAWFVVDCGQLNRIGEITLSLLQDHPLIVNIDHHSDNPRFGHVNWVKVTASTTLLLYELARQLGVEITPELATCLYAGIVADTDSFRNANVSAEVLRVSAELLQHGAGAREISVQIYERRTLPEIKLLGHTLLGAQIADGIIWSSIPQEVFRRTDTGVNDTERLVEELRATDGIAVAVLFKEMPTGKIKVSLRAKRDEVDVSRVARTFGGGGHKQAAGCLIPGALAEVETQVLAEVQRALKAHSNG